MFFLKFNFFILVNIKFNSEAVQSLKINKLINEIINEQMNEQTNTFIDK